MPNCFQLTRKGETQPSSLVKIDEEICGLVGQPVDARHYCFGWFDIIGFPLACGKSYSDIRQQFMEDGFENTFPEILTILGYLEENYTPKAWYEPKR